MKQILDLRPIYHRREERIRAHDILCWLAPPTHPHHRDGQGVADATGRRTPTGQLPARSARCLPSFASCGIDEIIWLACGDAEVPFSIRARMPCMMA